MKNENVILYCRESLNKPSDIFTINYEQENRLIRFCSKHGYNVVKVFTDYNSKTNKNNLQLQNMKEFVKNNDESVGAIFCDSFDRLSRNFEEILEMFKYYNMVGIKLISIEQLTNSKSNSND